MPNSSDQIAGQIAPAAAFNALRDDAFNDTAGGHTHLGNSTSGRLLLLSQVADLSDCGGIAVSVGGTGTTAHTANRIVLSGTATTGALRTSSAGTTGQVLFSGGASGDPFYGNTSGGGSDNIWKHFTYG